VKTRIPESATTDNTEHPASGKQLQQNTSGNTAESPVATTESDHGQLQNQRNYQSTSMDIVRPGHEGNQSTDDDHESDANITEINPRSRQNIDVDGKQQDKPADLTIKDVP
jgi:hypothetical protein